MKSSTGTVNRSESAGNAAPAWARAWNIKYTSGVAHAFVLHFNVQDYVVGNMPLRTYLSKVLIGSSENPLMDVVVFYDRARGIQFAVESMRRVFLEAVGLAESDAPGRVPPASNSDPLAAALGLAPGGFPGSVAQEELPTRPDQALPLLESLLKSTLRAAVIILAAETIVPAAEISIMSPEDRTNLVRVSAWGTDPEISASGNTVILVTPNLDDIHPQVRAASSKFESIAIGLPGFDERLAYLKTNLPRYTFNMALELAQVANATAGLGLIHIQDILLRAEQEGVLDLLLIKERKDDILASEYGEVLEMIEPRFGFEGIGGLEHVKKFFRRNVIDPIRTGNRGRVPQGVLMTGPAGTGKSAVAEAVAREAGVNAVALNMSKILGQYVGSSERNLEKALRAIKSLAPTLVFIDEIDQTVQRNTGGGDSGVSARIFKRLLEFMSDTGNRGRVVFLAATNRPDLMDAALRRPGRFDKKIPFLVPDALERASILQVMARRYGLGDVEAPVGAIEATDGWTGAELEAAAVKAIELVQDEALDAAEALIEATRRISPSTADIEFMTLLALKECDDLDLLPEPYKAMARDRKALEQKVDDNRGERKRTLAL